MSEPPLTPEELAAGGSPAEIESVWAEALTKPLPAYDLTRARAYRGSPVRDVKESR